MCCKNYWKKFVSFGLTFFLGLFVVNISQIIVNYNKAQELMTKENNAVIIQEKLAYKNVYTEQGSGFCVRYSGEGGRGSGGAIANSPSFISKPSKKSDSQSKPLQITYKPKPKYTKEARENNIQGNITIRVTFLASGEIGAITPVTTLPYGLTEQAIAAAKQMRFEPQTKNGKPQSVIKSVQFSFTIY